MKIGALRQRRLPVSSTGRGRRRCPCSASPVSAAGSGSAPQPPLGQRSDQTGQAARTAPEAKAYDFIIYLNPPAAL